MSLTRVGPDAPVRTGVARHGFLSSQVGTVLRPARAGGGTGPYGILGGRPVLPLGFETIIPANHGVGRTWDTG